MQTDPTPDLDPDTIIDRLGGTVETAQLCELTKGAVSQWRTNGIPKPWLMFLRAVRPDVFGLPQPAAEGVKPPRSSPRPLSTSTQGANSESSNGAAALTAATATTAAPALGGGRKTGIADPITETV